MLVLKALFKYLGSVLTELRTRDTEIRMHFGIAEDTKTEQSARRQDIFVRNEEKGADSLCNISHPL